MSKSMGFAALIMASTTALRVPPPVMQMYDAQRPAVSAPPGTAHVSGSVVPTKTQQSILVQGGGTLRTWSYRSPAVERVQVILSTEGRPLEADVELYNGPDNTPCKMRVMVENGQLRPFCAVIETPRYPNTVAIRNVGPSVFPFAATLVADTPTAPVDGPTAECIASVETIQGGALRTYPFHPAVESVQVFLRSDGRPLNARIELLQGPNNIKQSIELYSEDGLERPCFFILETPGPGHVVRINNNAPMAFPMSVGVVPLAINYEMPGGASPGTDVVLGGDVVIGGDSGRASGSSDGRSWWE